MARFAVQVRRPSFGPSPSTHYVLGSRATAEKRAGRLAPMLKADCVVSVERVSDDTPLRDRTRRRR